MFTTIMSGLTGLVLATGIVAQNQQQESACFSYATAHCMNIQYKTNKYLGQNIRQDSINYGIANNQVGTYDKYRSVWFIKNKLSLVYTTNLTGTLQTKPLIATSHYLDFNLDSKNIAKDTNIYKKNGHSFCVIGYNKIGVIAINSHGPSYGNKGRFIIRWEDTKKVEFFEIK